MKYCPDCKQEYKDEQSICSDCMGVALVERMDAAEAVEYYDRKAEEPQDFSGFEEVFAGNLYKAQLIAGELELEGIRVFVEGGELASSVGLPFEEGAVSFVRVLVGPDDLEKSKTIIAESKDVTEEELTAAAEESSMDEGEAQDA